MFSRWLAYPRRSGPETKGSRAGARCLRAEIIQLFDTKTSGVDFLAMTLKHSIHHRGQLSAYLRAMGGKIPAIYGPTADTQ